jgi:hypothetical protein
MNGEKIYRRICDADSIDAAVARLSRDALAAVAEHLAAMGAKGGIPAQIWGVVSARLSAPSPAPKRKPAVRDIL